MKRPSCIILLLLSIAGIVPLSCTGGRGPDDAPGEMPVETTAPEAPARLPGNAVYHWKTTFDLNPSELDFLKEHDIRRMYVRLFDVDVDSSPINDQAGAIPVGTTRFRCPVPAGMEIVPTVFITTKAILSIGGEEDAYRSLAWKIFARTMNMASFNDLGRIREIQLDCDWTPSTQQAFYEVCKEIKSFAEKDSVLVSATIRLHQLRLDPPPVDRGVLMVYNTGAVRLPGTKNSILELADVKSYLSGKAIDFKLPLDYAYPAFGWGVVFREGAYQGLLHHTDFSDPNYYADNGDGTYRVKKDHFLDRCFLQSSDVIRLEYPSADVIQKTAALVSSAFKEHPHSTILYHLDSQNLSKFTADEITDIYRH